MKLRESETLALHSSYSHVMRAINVDREQRLIDAEERLNELRELENET